MFNAHFTLQSSSPILSHDARSYLNYRVEVSKLTFVNQIQSEKGELQDLIVHGAANPAVALLKLNSNEVLANLKIQLLHRTEDEIQDDVTILFLDSGKKEKHSIRKPIECSEVADKNLALIFSIKVKMFSDLDKKVLGRLSVQATFLTINNSVLKSTEHNLTLGQLSHLKLSYQSFGHYYNLQLHNLTGVDLTVQRVTVKGADVTADMLLQRSETYSMIHNNSILADSVACSLSYSIPAESIKKYPTLTRNQQLLALEKEVLTSELREKCYEVASRQTIELDLVRPLPDQLVLLKLHSGHQCELNVPFAVKCEAKCLRKGNTFLFSMKEQAGDGMFITSKSSLLVAFREEEADTKTLEFELLPFKTGLFRLPEVSVQLMDGRLGSRENRRKFWARTGCLWRWRTRTSACSPPRRCRAS